MEKMLMNPISGHVQSQEEWEDDFAEIENELWGGPSFEDVDLIEVVKVKGKEGFSWEEV